MLVKSNQAQFLVQFEWSQGCSRLVQYYFSEKKKKIMGLMNRIPLTTTKELKNTPTHTQQLQVPARRCWDAQLGHLGQFSVVASLGMPISYFIESAFYQINLCSKKSARSVAGWKGHEKHFWHKPVSPTSMAAPHEKPHIYIFLLLHIWVILRCWGNSSILCQQNSDAL